MAESMGKKFEEVIRGCFEKVPDTSVTRLPDPVMGYLGYRNISDFIVYHYPHQFFIECKSCHGNTFPIGNIELGTYGNMTENQYKGLIEMSKLYGVIAGVIVWWVDKDRTAYIPINTIKEMREQGGRSISCQINCGAGIFDIPSQKKRVFFDYDMAEFFNHFRDKA